MYCFDSRVRYSEVGEDQKLTLGGILNYFQDCSTFQSEELGNGLEVMQRLKKVWVLSFWQIVLEDPPVLGSRITTGTWPYEFRGFLGSRNFIMKDMKGKVLAYANSLWTFLNLETGHPVRVADEILEKYQLEPKYEMDYAPRKILLPKEMKNAESFCVTKQYLDTNHHVNNGQYVVMAMNYLPDGFCVGQMCAEYKKSALLGDWIYPSIGFMEDKILVSLNDEDGKPYTIVEFTGRVSLSGKKIGE